MTFPDLRHSKRRTQFGLITKRRYSGTIARGRKSMSNQVKLTSRDITSVWRDLLEARGCLQVNACATLHRAKAHGLKDLRLSNGALESTLAIMESDLGMAPDEFSGRFLVPSIEALR